MPSFAIPNWSASVGRAFYATAVAFFGVQHLIHGAFVTRIIPPPPEWLGAPGRWAIVAGIGLIVAGIGLCLPRTARPAALILALVTLGLGALLALPPAVRSHVLGGEWTNAGKALALGGGALVFAASAARRDGADAPLGLLSVGRGTLAGFMVLAGVQHFIWGKFVAGLVPAWIPAPLFWTYLAGVALIAGGIGLLLPAAARLAAGLTALMVFLWVILLHIPRAWADLNNANETTAVFEALAFSGIALMLSAAAPRR